MAMNLAVFPHTSISSILSEADWEDRQREHIIRIDALFGSYFDRRMRGQKHPVIDFLFEYYSFRPALLKRWSPGAQVGIETSKVPKVFGKQACAKDGVFWLNPADFPDQRREGLRWAIDVLTNTAARQPAFGCAGMHEWAMVYKATDEQIRHRKTPLRLPQSEIDAFVESRPVVCSHFDAFRFFTDPARPLNKLQPEHKLIPALEQPGCLHANMDLYKWAYKFYPWVGSDLITDALELALKARRTDMEASPYDLINYGLNPILIETEAGREEYRQRQMEIWQLGIPVRERLIEALEILTLES